MPRRIRYGLSWMKDLTLFTPETELPFAGHPVLGSAFVLGLPLQRTVIRLETGVGVISVELEREGARIVFGRMEQPVPTWQPCEHEPELLAYVKRCTSRPASQRSRAE